MLNAFFQLVDFEADDRIAALKRQAKKDRQLATQRNSMPNSQNSMPDTRLGSMPMGEDNSDSDANSSFSSSSSTASQENEDDLLRNERRILLNQRRVFNEVTPDAIVQVLSCESNSNSPRSPNEIKLLQQALIHNSFFRRMRRKITQTLYQELFQEINLETFKPLDTIFKHGEPSNKFYIILSGEVCILTPLQRTQELQPQEQEQQAVVINQQQLSRKSQSIPASPEQTLSHQPSKSLSLQEPVEVKEQDPAGIMYKIAHLYPNCVAIKRLGSGSGFGEIGLFMDRSRTATVVCKTICEMLVLSKAAFQRILGPFFSALNAEKQAFFKRIPLFNGHSFAFMTNLTMNVRRRTYQYGDIIYEENSERKRLYFIRSGEVELSKKVELPSSQKVSAIAAGGKPQRIVVASKSENDWFGEVEIMQKVPRFSRARCVSAKLEVYHISARKIFSHLDQEQFLAQLKKHSQMLQEWRDDHYKSIVDNIYSNKDPLSKTFKNLKVGKQLVNEKFKQEFLKADVVGLYQQGNPQGSEAAVKNACFSKIKTYVNKITDVIGAISELKQTNKVNTNLIDDNRQNSKQQSKKHISSMSPSRYLSLSTQKSIPSAYDNSIYHNSSSSHSRIEGSFSHQPSPIKLPHKPRLNNSLILLQSRQSSLDAFEKLDRDKDHLLSNGKSSSNGQESQRSQIRDHRSSVFKTKSLIISSSIELDQAKLIDSPSLARPSQRFEIAKQPTIPSINSTQPSTSTEYMENLFDTVIQGKQSTDLTFNQALNQRIVMQGMAKKNRMMHQKKDRIKNFSNLHNALQTKGSQSLPHIQDRTFKLDLIKQLKLKDLLSYKYTTPANKQSPPPISLTSIE